MKRSRKVSKRNSNAAKVDIGKKKDNKTYVCIQAIGDDKKKVDVEEEMKLLVLVPFQNVRQRSNR